MNFGVDQLEPKNGHFLIRIRVKTINGGAGLLDPRNGHFLIRIQLKKLNFGAGQPEPRNGNFKGLRNHHRSQTYHFMYLSFKKEAKE